jgi:hypothetical protein
MVRLVMVLNVHRVNEHEPVLHAAFLDDLRDLLGPSNAIRAGRLDVRYSVRDFLRSLPD